MPLLWSMKIRKVCLADITATKYNAPAETNLQAVVRNVQQMTDAVLQGVKEFLLL